MNLANVIEAFSFPDRLPVQAIRACLSKPDDSVPAFLHHLQLCADNSLDPDDEDALFLITHMLGELGEQRAFQPLMDFLTGDQRRVDRVFGDAVTETLCQILISVYDGDETRLYEAMNTASVDEFLRDAVFRAWIYLVATGRIDRDEARAYLRNCPDRLRPRGDSHIWISWTDAIAHLGFEELSPLVREGFDDGRVNEVFMEFRDFEEDLERALGPEPIEAVLEQDRIHPFTDTIGVLSTWYGFSEAYLRDNKPPRTGMPLNDNAINPLKAVGRNDPCPCGSGKKYKKCCLT